MASEYAFRFTQKAVADLEELFRAVGQDLANPAAAAGLGRKIFKCIDDLCAFPRAGKPVENDFFVRSRRSLSADRTFPFVLQTRPGKPDPLYPAHRLRKAQPG